MITNAELTQIKERSEKATHGPWGMAADGSIHSKATHSYVLYTPTKKAEIVATGADFEFLLSAREDVPRLVAEVERLKKHIQSALFYVENDGSFREIYDELKEALGE